MIRTLVEIQGGRVSIRETAAGQTEVSVIVDSEASSPTGPLYKAAVDAERELVTAQRQVADLEVELERYRKAHVCTVECQPNQHTAFQGRRQVTELEHELERRTGERDERERARSALEAQMESERKRADQNKAWAERAEGSLRESRELVAFKSSVIAGLQDDLDRSQQKVRELTERETTEAQVTELERKVVDYDLDRTTERNRADRLAAQIGKVNGAVHSPEILSALVLAPGLSLESVNTLADAVRNVRQIVGSPDPETSQA